LAVFAIGLFPYLYFFVRAKTAVMPVAWSYPDSLPAFLRLIFRSDYGTFAPTVGSDPALVTLADKGQQLFKFFNYFLEDFWWPIIIPIILGLFVGLKKYWRFTVFILLAFFLSGIFFLTYANFPITDQTGFGLAAVERFYLLPYLFLALLAGLGISYLSNLRILSLILITFYAVMLLINNFGLINQKNNFWGENLGRNILSTVPENGLLLVQGDIPTFAVFYTHYVENFRPDIQIFTPNVAGQFNDYRYLRSVRPSLDYGSGKILTIPEFIVKNYQKISLSSYGQSKAEITALPSYQKGLITIFGGGKSYPVKLPDYQLPAPEEFKNHNTLADYTLLWYYARMNTNLGKICFDNQDYNCARDFLQKALVYTPNQLYLVRTLGLIYEKEQKCDQAEQEYKKILVLNPKALFAFSDLANLTKNCFKDEARAKYWQEQMAGRQNGPAMSLQEL
ncbi:hypothetical protein HY085_01860, partial [Candidatus Gottesmanbacteria bacterium]|nr:hypothetical protein [Candidatus Gottesmanbacteria bacterium]